MISVCHLRMWMLPPICELIDSGLQDFARSKCPWSSAEFGASESGYSRNSKRIGAMARHWRGQKEARWQDASECSSGTGRLASVSDACSKIWNFWCQTLIWTTPRKSKSGHSTIGPGLEMTWHIICAYSCAHCKSRSPMKECSNSWA